MAKADMDKDCLNLATMFSNENALPPLSSLPAISETVKSNADQTALNASLSPTKGSAVSYSKQGIGIAFGFGKLHSQHQSDTLFSIANAVLPLKFFLRDDFIVKVACGDEHSVFVSNTGRAFVIGKNNMGQLGLDMPHTQTVLRPTCIKSLKSERVYDAGCGAQHTLLASEGNDGKKRLLAFGINSDCQLGIGRNAGDMSSKPQVVLEGSDMAVVMLSGGRSHSAAVLSDFRLFIWGNGPEGQLGLGEQCIESDIPVQLNPPAGFLGFSSVSCGYYHTLAVTTPSALFACGETENGKLGLQLDNVTDSVFELKRVELGRDIEITAISAGGNHSIAVTTDGHVYAMGSGMHGQLGVGTSVSAQASLDKPTLLKQFSDSGIVVKSVSAGETHSAFVTDDGYLFLCGNALNSRLGFDVSANSFIPRMANLVDDSTATEDNRGQFVVTTVACGGCHTVCLANKSAVGRQRPLEDTTNFTATSTLLSTSSGRISRRARRMAAQSLQLPNVPPQAVAVGESVVSKSMSDLPPVTKGATSVLSTVATSDLTPVSTIDSEQFVDAKTPNPEKQITAAVPEEQVAATSPAVLPSSPPPPAAAVEETASATTVQQPVEPGASPSAAVVVEAENTTNPSEDNKPVETPKPEPPKTPVKNSGMSLPLLCGRKKGQQVTTKNAHDKKEEPPKSPEDGQATAQDIATASAAVPDEAEKDDKAKDETAEPSEARKEGAKEDPQDSSTDVKPSSQPTKTCTVL